MQTNIITNYLKGKLTRWKSG